MESMFERYLTQIPILKKGGTIEPMWMGDGSRFCFSEGEGANREFYMVDPVKNSKSLFFDAGKLHLALEKNLGYPPAGKGIPFEAFTLLDDEKAVEFILEGRHFRLSLEDYQVSELPCGPEPSGEEKKRSEAQVYSWLWGEKIPETPSNDGHWFLGVKDSNLYLRSTYDGSITFLTRDGSQKELWDARSAKFSLDNRMLAAKKVDLSPMPVYSVVHWLSPIEEVEAVPWAKAGEPMWRELLYVIDLTTKEVTAIDTGEIKDHYVTVVGWLPGELIYARFDRRFKQMDLLAVNVSSGKTRTILTETSETFINLSPFDTLPITPLSDGAHFIWHSERDGWGHLYLYDIQGNLVQRLTQGKFVVFHLVGVDETGGWVYFYALDDPRRPYDVHLCRVKFDGTGFERLTEATGVHQAQLSPSKQYFLDTHSTVSRPTVTELRRADGEKLQILSTASIDRLLTELDWKPPEEFWVKASDGVTDLHGVMYKPHDFNPDRKYPVIEYIYGGPHTLDVPLLWPGESYYNFEALAQEGFIVYLVDGRGTIGRGRAFQDVCHGKMGQHEIPEHVAVLKQLGERFSFMDLKRVGIFGLSYGGYITLRAMLTAADVYHVGVATCPVPGLAEMVWIYVEHYNDLPSECPQDYQNASCLDIAGNLKGKLLMVHGTTDKNALISGTMKMAEAFVRAGKPYDLMILPEQLHIYTGTSYRYYVEMLRRYFVEHLKPNEPDRA